MRIIELSIKLRANKAAIGEKSKPAPMSPNL